MISTDFYEDTSSALSSTSKCPFCFMMTNLFNVAEIIFITFLVFARLISRGPMDEKVLFLRIFRIGHMSVDQENFD